MENQLSTIKTLLAGAIHAQSPKSSMARAMSALALRNGKMMREGRRVEIDAICAMAELTRGLTCRSKSGLPGDYSLVRNCARNALSNLNEI